MARPVHNSLRTALQARLPVHAEWKIFLNLIGVYITQDFESVTLIYAYVSSYTILHS